MSDEVHADPPRPAEPYRAVVVTVSDRSSRGVRPDRSGPLLAEGLEALGLAVTGPVLVPDDAARIEAELRAAVAGGATLVVTTGGTGLHPTDVTPEATAAVVDRLVPGIAEALRVRAAPRVPTAVLSRGIAGTAGRCLVVNLPGSTGGVRDGLAVLAEVLDHALAQVTGADLR